MSSEDMYFDILGVNTNSRNYQVLKVILEILQDNGRSPTFAEIEESVNAEREEPFSKQWIYKCLANLENEQMITVDRINKPIRYASSLIDVRKGLDRLVLQRLKDLEQRRKEVKQEIDELEKMNTYDFAYWLVDRLSRGRPPLRSGIIEGVDNIRSAISFELCEQSKSGDIIRMSYRSTSIASRDTDSIPLDQMLLKTTEKGVRIRILDYQDKAGIRGGMASFWKILNEERSLILNSLASNVLDIRVPREPMPFLIMALNTEKAFIFISNMCDPESVALLHREDNPILFDNMIERFDRVFNGGKSLNKDIYDSITRYS